MWLPETAVDMQTLEVLAELGIKFTILSPYQAGRVRPLGGRVWRKVDGAGLILSMAYAVRVGFGKAINVFFYDGPISRAIAFEDLLADGKRFSDRLLGAFSDARTWPQLVHIATDGETYGHHRAYGDMALAFALHLIETSKLAKLTNYGGISRETSAHHGSQDHRQHFLELRPRDRALAKRLRLQLRRPRRLEPALESATAPGVRLAA